MNTVVLAGGPTLVRAAMAAVMESTHVIAVVGQAADGAQLRTLIEAGSGPDVILLDRRIQPGEMSEFAHLVAAASATARTIVFGVSNAQEAETFLRAGATGLLATHITAVQLIEAVYTVLRGGLVVVLETAPSVMANHHLVGTLKTGRVVELSKREREILTMLASGQEASGIADALNISPFTVKTHIANMLTKIGVRQRGHLIAFAYENGIVVPGATPMNTFIDHLSEVA
ncbi:response regulator transcription factor [Streptomyces sp. NPDC002701]|uniref:response regulator transcription factor n=1 Tax=Streptomyces sp. NPDC002701 TaxID=3364661 RepID=UPI0036AE76D1